MSRECFLRKLSEIREEMKIEREDFDCLLAEFLKKDIQEIGDKPKAEGMQSLRKIYKIGPGPSSSHTMGPQKASRIFKEKYPDADSFKVVLFGSLAKTGEGHRTDYIIKKTFEPLPIEIENDLITAKLPHPNTMDLYAYKDGKEIGKLRVMSVGGGNIEIEGHKDEEEGDCYSLCSLTDIIAYCKEHQISLWQYVEETEGADIWAYLQESWDVMRGCIKAGLQATGILPGGLDVHRKARYIYEKNILGESVEMRESRIVSAYAYAVSEENAYGGTIVTSPTCGASGILPAVMLYYQEKLGCSDEDILKALATGGLIGNLIKTNASVSGAECGCQAEVGSACSMASAALAELLGMNLKQIEYAAEIAMEHHLGLTCDPINGLVQIPCIERNAVAAMRAIHGVNLANFLSDTQKISFDLVVKTMYETGRDLNYIYRETSEGGLAKLYNK